MFYREIEHMFPKKVVNAIKSLVNALVIAVMAAFVLAAASYATAFVFGRFPWK